MLKAIWICPVCETRAEGEGTAIPSGWIHVQGQGHLSLGERNGGSPNFGIEGAFDRRECLQRWVDSLVANAVEQGLNPD